MLSWLMKYYSQDTSGRCKGWLWTTLSSRPSTPAHSTITQSAGNSSREVRQRMLSSSVGERCFLQVRKDPEPRTHKRHHWRAAVALRLGPCCAGLEHAQAVKASARESARVGRVTWNWRRTARAGKDARADAREEGVEEGNGEVGVAHLDAGKDVFLVEARGAVESQPQHGRVQRVCPAGGVGEASGAVDGRRQLLFGHERPDGVEHATALQHDEANDVADAVGRRAAVDPDACEQLSQRELFQQRHCEDEASVVDLRVRDECSRKIVFGTQECHVAGGSS